MSGVVTWTCLICGVGTPAADWPPFFSHSQGPVVIRCPSCWREILRGDVFQGAADEFPQTRSALLARLVDIVHRSGVSDADALAAALGQRLGALCPLCRKTNLGAQEDKPHLGCLGRKAIEDAQPKVPRTPPPGTYGPDDYGPDSFGGSDFE